MNPTLLLKALCIAALSLVTAACAQELPSQENAEFEQSSQLTTTSASSWLANYRRTRKPRILAGSAAPAPVAGSVAPAPVAGSVAPAPVAGSVAPAPVAGSVAPAPVGSFPGGFIEATTSTQVRARLSAAQLQALLPAAGGKFTFPAPYGTEAVRLTDASSCAGGRDCVRAIGYSYWRNTNNHVGQDSMLIMLGLDSDAGGTGLSLFRMNKSTSKLDKLGPVFAGTRVATNVSGEDIYFSGTRPNIVYVAQGSELLRVDVITKAVEVVFNTAATYGANTYLWQHHSSDDDVVHSATLRVQDTWATLGCVVYREDTKAFTFFPPKGDFDECQVDRSGDWLVIKENVDGANGEDNRIVNLKTFTETTLLDQNGAAGHSDLGFGVMIAEDNWNNLPGAVRAWTLGQSPMVAPLVYHETQWREGSSHITHTNAMRGVALKDEVACQSTSSRGSWNRGSEIFCYRLDGSLKVMVVAPVTTDLNAAGGGDDYGKAPKGNLDVTGRYFVWTTNNGGSRLDAFIVKVPTLLFP